MKAYEGKRVLVTGAAAGIGLCTAREFAANGAELVLTDVNAVALARAAEELRQTGAIVHSRAYDASDEEAVTQAASWAVGELGGVDVLVNNAGVGHHGELADTNMATWRRLMDVNFWSALHHVYALLPHMRARGSGQIVNVSSGQAFFRMPTWGAYTATKVALAAFSEILHFELRKCNIAVTTVYPFLVNTGFYQDVQGETLGARLSMRLLPLYSMRAPSVGKIIYRAAVRRRRVEMVTVLNDLGQLASVTPLVPTAMGTISTWVLAKKEAPRAA